MLKSLNKFLRLKRFQSPDFECSAQLSLEPDSSILKVGSEEIFLRTVDADHVQPKNGDFAVFALSALSMSKNWEISVEFPVSDSAVAQCQKISNAYRLWSIDVLAPLRLNFTNVVSSNSRSEAPGIICLSGGLDSMSAAIEAVASGRTTGAMLVAGADYKTAAQSGFVELRDRVQSISDALSLELRVMETNFRKIGFHWDMLHSSNLAFCLHHQAGDYGFGTFAQDNNSLQDLFRMPWGNLNVLPDLYTTDAFPITTFGKDKDRVDKLKTVLDYDDRLLEHLSVCYTNKSIGGNCGKCPKCTEMRIALKALGADGRGLFEQEPDLVKAVQHFKVPKKLSAVRGRMARTAELVDALPDNELRDALVKFENRLRWRFHRLMPSTETP